MFGSRNYFEIQCVNFLEGPIDLDLTVSGSEDWSNMVRGGIQSIEVSN